MCKGYYVFSAQTLKGETMTKGIVLYTKVGEDSAHMLAEVLQADIENPYKTGERDYSKYLYVFKFGFSKAIRAKRGCTFNRKTPTEIAIDKRKTFSALAGTGTTVEYTESLQEAQKWLEDGHVLAGRETTTGSNGEGLVYIQTLGELGDSPATLWTKLVDEVQELRAYMWRNKVIALYVKTIKVSKGIFRFKLIPRSELYIHPQLVEIATNVYDKIGLDFCGVDIIADTAGKLNVLEVNSAPILFPYTIKQLVKEINTEIMHNG